MWQLHLVLRLTLLQHQLRLQISHQRQLLLQLEQEKKQPLLQPLLPRRYRVVPAERIAHHLLRSALAAEPGCTVLPSEALV